MVAVPPDRAGSVRHQRNPKTEHLPIRCRFDDLDVGAVARSVWAHRKALRAGVDIHVETPMIVDQVGERLLKCAARAGVIWGTADDDSCNSASFGSPK